MRPVPWTNSNWRPCVNPNGTTAQISTSYRSWYAQQVAIYGSEGKIQMERAFNIRERWSLKSPNLPASVYWTDRLDTVHQIDFPAVDQFVLQLRHLCRCLDRIESPRIGILESLDNMATIDAIYESMRTGQPVRVAPMTQDGW